MSEQVKIATSVGEREITAMIKENLPNDVLTKTDTGLTPYLGVTTNVGDVYSIITDEVITPNKKYTLTFNNPSTSSPVISINGGDNIPILKPNGNSPKLYASVYSFFYDGNSFILLGEGGDYGTALPSDVRNTKTIATEDGMKQGTLNLDNLKPENVKKNVNIGGVIGNKLLYGTGDSISFGLIGNRKIPFVLCYKDSVDTYGVDNNGYLYANDYNAYIFKKYNQSGDVIWQTSIKASHGAGMGILVEDNTYIYVNEYSSSTYYLSRVNKYSGETIKITSTPYAIDSVIGVVGEYVYIQKHTSSGTNSPFYIILNGGGKSVSSAIGSSASYNYAVIQGNYLYTSSVVSGTITIKKFDISVAGEETLIWTYTGSSTYSAIVVTPSGTVFYYTSTTINMLKSDGSGVLMYTSGLNISSDEVYGGENYIIFKGVGGVFNLSLVQLSTKNMSVQGCSQNGKYFVAGYSTATYGYMCMLLSPYINL